MEGPPFAAVFYLTNDRRDNFNVSNNSNKTFQVFHVIGKVMHHFFKLAPITENSTESIPYKWKHGL